MFVGIISGKPSRDFTRSLGSPKGLKGLLHTLNTVMFPVTEEVEQLLFSFSFYFPFCIAKGLAICKFGGVISVECYTFKPLNLHMLSSYFCYSLMFCNVFAFSYIL
jgi:hypothetical protein